MIINGIKAAINGIASQLALLWINKIISDSNFPAKVPNGPTRTKAKVPATKIIINGFKMVFMELGQKRSTICSKYFITQTINKMGITEEE